MKTSLLFKGALGALALAVAAPVFAAPAAPTSPAPPSASNAPDHFRGGHGFRGGRMGPGRFQRPSAEDRAKRRAEQFGRMDANRDGRVTEPEFNAYIEARKRERQHRAFLRFSGDQDAVTLDQLNARALERERAMERRRGEGRRGPGMMQRGPGVPPNLGGPPNPPRPGI